ncbi:hypothetical protein [Pararhodobacter zhoushanensis]|uniref:Uncharacterized protein n=1 Tax=Pararhodobacter zhoushanensis TaxID=2479545 RepID=A0ABT3GX66_9RHOB|nr:hypothetical protein [Pararhodobacter zhoushanensis]MCW1404168.1 hypothetical protein [Novosphingobium sp. MW5]MCW1932138.1 hypothetical protein [Pararhodobacter zhoushanensis]
MRKAFIAAACCLLPLSATAQVIADCDWVGSPANIFEPWDTHSRSFANGAIRVALLDTGGEPACCSRHLLILSPSGDGSDEPIFRQCRVASAQVNSGFYDVDVPGITASYDPAKGLLLSVPVGHWHEGVEAGRPPIVERMEIRINQSTGTVAVE